MYVTIIEYTLGGIMTIVWFILILGAIVGIHEFGHFIFAKLSNTYVYEFSIGMGKKLFGKKKKGGETEFCLRLIPIGGYVMIAGEDTVTDDKIPADRQMCNKNFIQRFMILFAGIFNNFVFAFLLLFISALIYGAISTKPVIGSVVEGLPAYEAGIREGDLITKIDGDKISSWDIALIKLQLNNGETLKMTVKRNGKTLNYNVKPVEVEDEEGNKSYKFGITTSHTVEKGFISSIKYASVKTYNLTISMWETIKCLFTGKVSVKDFSGPVGIYTIVGTQSKQGLEAILYLTAYLSINVGFINFLPLPAFDGGRILFLILEKLTGNRISKKTEAIIHTIGFFLLIALLIYITFNDIIRIFH